MADDRARGAPLLPVPVCDAIDGSGWGCTGHEWCQGWSGGPSWIGGNPPLPVAACVLPPWSRHRASPVPDHPAMSDRVLRRELVTGARVLVPTDGRCAPCRGTGGADEDCEACGASRPRPAVERVATALGVSVDEVLAWHRRLEGAP